MPYLNWISDQDLEFEVNKIMLAAATGINKATDEFNNNVIDPFSIIFEMSGFGISTVEQWELNEKARKAQKTLSNSFGTFHQSIIGKVANWTDLGIGNSADLENSASNIIAEVKNKYNTVKGSDLVDVYLHLESLVMPIASRFRNYTAYYVEIIPKKPQMYDIPFTPSDRATGQRKPANPRIRKIDGKSFYALATGDPNALPDLYSVLPEVMRNTNEVEFSDEEIELMNNYFQRAFG